MPERTTRERIADALRAQPRDASALAAEFDVTRAAVYDHIEHVSRSVPEGQQLLVAPPECRDCGFDGFDDRINTPSRCPKCKGENVEEPTFVIEA
ncbi:transcriptional regulator [Halobaculum sp. CBA1158]|uniref:transcriptional regulator n=1 Tax=Halobaculum sp. CBA1158 TaxID=2904243 RepID=UPI001F2D5033|nr:transcriptional regulator [Halobaculum sp. CBA1158]UIO98448.1 transcriptional regulator [Halobaculum sp. CBA1158]